MIRVLQRDILINYYLKPLKIKPNTVSYLETGLLIYLNKIIKKLMRISKES